MFGSRFGREKNPSLVGCQTEEEEGGGEGEGKGTTVGCLTCDD